MGNIKFNSVEKNDIEILRCLLQLNTPWLNELEVSDNNKKKQLMESCLLVLDKIIQNSNLTKEEINILNDALINKHEKMEKVGSKYFYSDSGIRNRINLILKKLLEQTNKI